MVDSISIATEHISRVEELLGTLDKKLLATVVGVIGAARDKGKFIFIAGNGGSSATASHFAVDIAKGASRSGKRPIKAISLTDNVPWLTAVANDLDYKQVFDNQISNLGSTGDVLIVISASGNSPNVVQAVELASESGITTIGLLGFDGGKVKTTLDHAIHVPTLQDEYEVSEDCHSIICHIIARSLAADVAGELT